MTLQSRCIAVLFILAFTLLPLPVPAQEEETSEEPSGFDPGFSFEYSLLNVVRFNRTEGAFLGGEISIMNDRLPGWALINQIGYGDELKGWRYNTTLEYKFDPFYYRVFSFSVFDETYSNDDDFISNVENTLAAALFHTDYRDFYRVKGFSGRFAYKHNENVRAVIRFASREFSSMDVRSDWSLFYKDRDYRPNPAAAPGKERLATIELTFSNRTNIYVESDYWEMTTRLERELNDFDFNGLHLMLRRTQLGRGNQTFIGTIRGGFRSGTAAEQYLMDLGGIGTLRGYGFKEFTGNARVILNGVYRFNGDILQRIPLQRIPFYSSLSSGVFVDGGMAWFLDGDRDDAGWNVLQARGVRETGSALDDMKLSVGASLYLLNNFLRFDFSRRLDTGRDPFMLSVRLLWGAEKLQ